MKYAKVDADGFFVEDVIVDTSQEVPENYISKPVPEGLYKPQWTGEEWVEGLSQDELEKILNAPRPVGPYEAIGDQLVDLELENCLLKQQNEFLGSQLVELELRLLQLEGGNK